MNAYQDSQNSRNYIKNRNSDSLKQSFKGAAATEDITSEAATNMVPMSEANGDQSTTLSTTGVNICCGDISSYSPIKDQGNFWHSKNPAFKPALNG